MSSELNFINFYYNNLSEEKQVNQETYNIMSTLNQFLINQTNKIIDGHTDNPFIILLSTLMIQKEYYYIRQWFHNTSLSYCIPV